MGALTSVESIPLRDTRYPHTASLVRRNAPSHLSGKVVLAGSPWPRYVHYVALSAYNDRATLQHLMFWIVITVVSVNECHPKVTRNGSIFSKMCADDQAAKWT